MDDKGKQRDRDYATGNANTTMSGGGGPGMTDGDGPTQLVVIDRDKAEGAWNVLGPHAALFWGGNDGSAADVQGNHFILPASMLPADTVSNLCTEGHATLQDGFYHEFNGETDYLNRVDQETKGQYSQVGDAIAYIAPSRISYQKVGT